MMADGDADRVGETRRGCPPGREVELSGWGRFPRRRSSVHAIAAPAEVASCLSGDGPVIARGNGRSYGDAAIGAGSTLSMVGLDRLIAFDSATGRLTAEAGILLRDIIDAFLPRGWFPPVVPGTRLVTLGGAIASNVHGKNHHGHGGFARCLDEFTLMTPRDGVLKVSRASHPDLFAATIGGMGLTGIILDAMLRLRPVETGWVSQRTVATRDLAETMKILREEEGATYSVAWIDCLARGAEVGRSLVYLGEHATRDELAAARGSGAPLFPPAKQARLTVPIDAPGFVLNPLSMRLFNELYYRKGARGAGKKTLVPWQPYFFPLDGVGDWNRIYGRRGFVQHQCVLPHETAGTALPEIMGRVARRGDASFLAVLKAMGACEGDISFAMPGFTLTLDFPVRDGLLDFLDELDKIVVSAGGRLYLAKDARQSRATFEAGYPSLERFRTLRHASGAAPRYRSFLSERLGL